MSQPIWRLLLNMAQQQSWPADETGTADSRRIYLEGLDLVNSYRGDPEPLSSALDKFRVCGSAGYAKAGVAAVLMTAAYIHGDKYDAGGLQAAESHLHKADRILPGRPEIEHLQAKLHLLRKQNSDARRILDRLLKTDPDDFFTSSIDLWYWFNERDISQARASFERAKRLAQNSAQRSLIANQMAGCYQTFGNPADAVEAFRDITHAAPDDPWAWHNLSIQLLQIGRTAEAEQANTQALQLMEFPAARQVQSIIQKSRGGLWSRLTRLFKPG